MLANNNKYLKEGVDIEDLTDELLETFKEQDVWEEDEIKRKIIKFFVSKEKKDRWDEIEEMGETILELLNELEEHQSFSKEARKEISRLEKEQEKDHKEIVSSYKEIMQREDIPQKTKDIATKIYKAHLRLRGED